MSLSQMAVKPRPRFQKRIIGYSSDRVRLPFYIGVSTSKGRSRPISLRLPNDRSFLVSILISGPSGSGKSVTTRVLEENIYLEWKVFGHNWRHPIFIIDSKTNYLGLDKPNRRKRDRYLLNAIHPKWNIKLFIPKDFIHVYIPGYVAPANRQEILKEMKRKWGAENFWGVPWRHITDLAHLGTVLKVPGETLWVEDLRPAFDKATLDKTLTFRDLVKANGYLEKAAKRIRNASSRNAALNFVERWRKNRYWFSDKNNLVKYLEAPFSVNVLTFVQTPEKVYFNQLALLIALESLMAKLQESTVEMQPVIVIHDILNFIGEEKPFRKEILDALKRLLAGQARTLAHGYIVIIETQTLDLPKELSDPKKYTIHIKMKWKSQSQNLAQTSGFIGGCADVHDHFRDFHCPDVVIRPPLTSYTV